MDTGTEGGKINLDKNPKKAVYTGTRYNKDSEESREHESITERALQS